MGRRFNPRLAKSLRCYTIIEVAELYRVHRNTVRHWLVNGLAPIDENRPLLIHGEALNNFHRARRLAGRQTCGPAEIYCLGCRKPRRPAGDIADLIQKGSVRTLIAICPDCDSMMTQRVSAERLSGFTSEITICPQLDSGPIEESSVSSPNYNLNDAIKSHETKLYKRAN